MRLKQERMLPLGQRVTRWRNRAEKLRTVADASKVEQTGTLLLDIASTYERMIEQAEKAFRKTADDG